MVKQGKADPSWFEIGEMRAGLEVQGRVLDRGTTTKLLLRPGCGNHAMTPS